MNKDKALELALEAWQTSVYGSESHHKAMLLAMTNMAQALAAPVQEPVAYVVTTEVHGEMCTFIHRIDLTRLLPDGALLYTTPPAAQPATEKSSVAQTTPVQEPVAWINAEKRTFEWNGPVLWNTPTVAVLDKIPLYTTPPQRPVPEDRKWVGLTDEDLANCSGHEVRWALYWEKLLKEKNT